MKPINIFYRLATQQDFQTLYELDKSHDKYHWERQNFNDKQFITIALINDKIMGFLVYQITDVIEVLRISVATHFQRKGVALSLLEQLKKYQKNLILEVRENNTTAINLYQKFGFKQITFRKNYYRNGENAKIMQCILV